MFHHRARCVAWAWGLLVTAAAIGLFVYQVGLNLSVYLDKPTVFIVSLEPNPAFRLPPVSLCPVPAFDPVKLKSLGLNISGNYRQFEDNYLNLLGVPENLEVGRLWEEAAWDLNQMIDSTFFKGGVLLSYYQHSGPMPPMWRRSYSPLGPCLTFSAPPGERIITIYLENLPFVEPCRLPNEEGELERYRGLSSQCSRVAEMCNSSCGLEDYIYYRYLSIKEAFIYLHETPVYTEEPVGEEDVSSYSRKLFDGNYMLRLLSYSPNMIVTPQLVDSSLIKGECTQDPSYSHGHCYQEAHAATARKELGCFPVYPSDFKKASGRACHSAEQFSKLFTVENTHEFICLQKCKRRRWKFDITDGYDAEFMISFKADTTDVRQEVEMETYPLTQFFSDAGGSLGLFLGVSILTFWEVLVAYVKRLSTSRKESTDEHPKHHMFIVVRYVGVLLLALGTGTHCLETLRSYLSQPKLTAVSLGAAPPQHPSDTALVARRLASRALHCRPQESGAEECLVTCLLKSAADEIASVAPFINLEGLPLCRDAGLSLPSVVYVVPQEILLAALTKERLNKCRLQCVSAPVTNRTHSTGFAMIVDNGYYSDDLLTLVCSMSGIVGLYLGWSIFDGLDLSHNIMTSRAVLSSARSSVAHRVLKVVVVAVGVLLALWQLHTYLLYHEVSASINKVPRENRSEQLAITVCRWPPLSLQHVAAQLGLNISDQLLYKLPKEERQPELLKVLNTLPGNWSNFSLNDLWQHAAWDVTDLVEGFYAVTKDGTYYFCDNNPPCSELWQPVITPLNRCFSMNASFNGMDINEITLLFLEVLEKKSIFGTNPQVYFTVTPAGEPLLLDQLVPKTAYHTVIATHHSARYESLNTRKHTKLLSHSSCIYQCVAESGTDSLRCRLPYMHWRPDLSPCDQAQYASIPGYFKGLEGIGRGWKDLKNSSESLKDLIDQRNDCYKKCRHLELTHQTISVEEELSSYPIVMLRLFQAEDVVLQEEDHHTSSQLVSDLGGIAGFTAGFSLLYLLKDLLPRLLSRRRNQ